MKEEESVRITLSHHAVNCLIDRDASAHCAQAKGSNGNIAEWEQERNIGKASKASDSREVAVVLATPMPTPT